MFYYYKSMEGIEPLPDIIHVLDSYKSKMNQINNNRENVATSFF